MSNSSHALSNYYVQASDGTPLKVYEFGNPHGELIVLCHGILVTHNFWNPIIAELSEKYHIVSYDQRGHGLSGGSDGKNCTHEQLGHDLHSILSTITKGRKAFLVGHSMGGITIGSWVRNYSQEVPQFTTAILLCNTAYSELMVNLGVFGFHLPNWEFLKNISWIFTTVPLRKNTLGRKIVHRTNFWGPVDDTLLNDVIIDSSRSSKASGKLLVSLTKMDILDSVSLFPVPTTVLISEHDLMTYPEGGRAIAQKLSETGFLRKLEVITDSGHISLTNTPKEFRSIFYSALADAHPGTSPLAADKDTHNTIPRSKFTED